MEALTNGLSRVKVENGESTLSFEDRGFKLNNADDALPIVKEIEAFNTFDTFILKGNTINIPAAEKISNALKKCHNLKRALWSDMFTGRSKVESPPALVIPYLKLMCDALMTARVSLTELDLCDNAFGPAGADAIKDFLRSSSAYTLQVLKLNNDGLGIFGARIISESLIYCYNSAKNAGTKFELKVFIAGRNRLENDGSKALADAFKLIGTLEEVSIPQNGIYYDGIHALCDAFAHNPNLKCINLEDNTLSAFGAESVAKILPRVPRLKILNLNDCLLRSKGAMKLAKALLYNCDELEELLVCGNEINKSAALEIGEAIFAKSRINKIDIGGNNIGEDGIADLDALFEEHGVAEKLLFSCEDEGEASEGDIDEFQDIEREDEDQLIRGGDEGEECADNETENLIDLFLTSFESETLCDLGEDGPILLAEALRDDLCDPYYAVHLLLNISNLITPMAHPQVKDLSASICSQILKSCNYGQFINVLCQNLGLIKDEFNRTRRPLNLYGIQYILKSHCQLKDSKFLRDILKFLIERRLERHLDEIDLWAQFAKVLTSD
uniref:Ran GTPase-activating protein 1 n=1 Tax=Romanomermis culicivorax TaxID=13658 RepID=A0A915KSN4_ROMCU